MVPLIPQYNSDLVDNLDRVSPGVPWDSGWGSVEQEAGPSQQPSVMVQGDHDLQLAPTASSSTAGWTGGNGEVPDLGLLNSWDNASFTPPYQDFGLLDPIPPLGPIGSPDYYGGLYSTPDSGPAASPYDYNNPLFLDLEWNNNADVAYTGPDPNPHTPYIAFPDTGSSASNPSYQPDQRH